MEAFPEFVDYMRCKSKSIIDTLGQSPGTWKAAPTTKLTPHGISLPTAMEDTGNHYGLYIRVAKSK